MSYRRAETTRDITESIRARHLARVLGRPPTAAQVEGLSGRLEQIPTSQLPRLLLLRARTDLGLFRRRPRGLRAGRLAVFTLRRGLWFTRRVLQQISRRARSRLRASWRRLTRRDRSSDGPRSVDRL